MKTFIYIYFTITTILSSVLIASVINEDLNFSDSELGGAIFIIYLFTPCVILFTTLIYDGMSMKIWGLKQKLNK